MQIILYLLSIVIVFLVLSKIRGSDRAVNIILAFYWFWMGIVYHLIYFTPINKAAYGFGTLFIIQGLLFLNLGVIRQRLTYRNLNNFHSLAACVLIFYALFIYPILGYILGHQYPNAPTLGLPCPTTIFTLGILLCSEKRLPVTILIIPVLWSFIGFIAAFKFGIWEDTGLLIAGIATCVIYIYERKTK